MKIPKMSLAILFVVVIGLLVHIPGNTRAHCDTMSGPVIAAARQALDTGNVNLVLIWVQPKDEGSIREQFEKARTGRQMGKKAKEVAEMRFFEALVRIHRAGEGAPYTGIKPAGTDVGPAVPAADHALQSGSVAEVQKLLGDAVRVGVQKHFQEAIKLRRYDQNDVAAGRAFVKAYVEYTHYVEGVYQMATTAGHHEHGETESHGTEHGAARQGREEHH
jgi:hypothetical protein